MADPARTTKLGAVNAILSAIGEQPVTALGEDLDADLAEDMLDEASREIQARGWHFNTEKLDITLDGSGKYEPSSNVTAVDRQRLKYNDVDLVMRDDSGTLRLYDLYDNTFVLGAASGTVKDVVFTYMYDFEKLPQAIRHFVMIKAARRFQDRFFGSNLQGRYGREDEARAEAEAKRYDLRQRDANILNADTVCNTQRRLDYFHRF